MHYITAALNIVSDQDFDYIMKELKDFEVETNKEPGCIQFHIYPLSREERKLMLWEIWENEEAVNTHFKLPHTKALFAQKLTEVEWILKSDVE